jgi:hypothetical protein
VGPGDSKMKKYSIPPEEAPKSVKPSLDEVDDGWVLSGSITTKKPEAITYSDRFFQPTSSGIEPAYKTEYQRYRRPDLSVKQKTHINWFAIMMAFFVVFFSFGIMFGFMF